MHESEDEQRRGPAYEASLRVLDEQRRSLDEIRSRTGVLLAGASISASFLGSKAFERHADVIVTCLALAALVATLLLGVVVLALNEGLVFALSGPTLHSGLLLAQSRADQHRQLAIWLDALHVRNKPAIERIDGRFRLASFALAIQIVLWTLALAASVS